MVWRFIAVSPRRPITANNAVQATSACLCKQLCDCTAAHFSPVSKSGLLLLCGCSPCAVQTLISQLVGCMPDCIAVGEDRDRTIMLQY